MNKESLKTLVKSVDTQLFEIANNLICSICQELFNKPVTTPCCHSFCSGCIKRVLSSKNNSGCPLCKTQVKRYGLEADEAKSKLSDICKELPVAFEKDVRELTRDLKEFEEDLVKSLKLPQLNIQECGKESKSNKKNPVVNKKNKKENESVASENESESFCPVLKRSKNVLEYVSAKKKKMDDFVSISQTDPASNSSLYGSPEINKKLEKIEKIPPEKKINEWFDAVGDNIYIASPGFSLESSSKNGSDGERKNNDKPTMIRRDYNKSTVVWSKNNGSAIKTVSDPYEFVPSQNNKVKKKRTKKSTAKKIPDFKAIQSFSKENIKRYTILLDSGKEDIEAEEETKNMPTEKLSTASQKFEQLLTETKQEQKKPHALFSASPSSSLQFLDVSFHSEIEKSKNKRKSKFQKTLEDSTTNVELFSDCREIPRKSTDSLKRGKKRKLFEDVEKKRDDTPESIKDQTKPNTLTTKLGELLQELNDDYLIYSTIPTNQSVKLPEATEKELIATQTTELIGFCTQEENANEKDFKRMVETMEKELNSSQYLIKDLDYKSQSNCDYPEKSLKEESVKSANENSDCDPIEQVPKTFSIKFLRLGRLTPIRKRTKSTVVKLVFPIGLTSLARRQALLSRYIPAPNVPVKQQVSTGIQTSQKQTVSSVVQTSQVPQSCVSMQSPQKMIPAEVQTTQKLTTSTEMQTSQRLICQEIQTTQVECESAQIQTTQVECESAQIQTTQVECESAQIQTTQVERESAQIQTTQLSSKPKKTPMKFRKSKETASMFGSLTPAEKDFELEKEFNKTWQSTQKHEQLVELKNKKNKEKTENSINKKSSDQDSDDSDIKPPKRRSSFRILSEESAAVSQEYETRQLVPLDVKKISCDEDMEIINLSSPGSQNSEDQMLKVLKNIDLDLPKGKSVVKNDKSEESDSDFFVEQTPPRPVSRAFEDIRRSHSSLSEARKPLESENSDGIDLIGDSIPKGFSESFQLLNSQKNLSVQRHEEEIEKANFSRTSVDLPNENDQNQINSVDSKTKPREFDAKTQQLKAVVEAWKRSEPPSPLRTVSQRKFCVVASSVKNPDLVRKFASKFKLEYMNKPTKDMTHLIVGLHENEDKEMLPLCTPKLLFAMANKKWVVNELWAETSLKMNLVLPEESFETLDPIGGNGCRKARLSREKLLKNCEIYLLGEFQMISKEDFADLITDCGGTLVPAPEKFSFQPSKLRMIIADRDCLNLNERQLQEFYQQHSTVILSRDVIIMSIQSYKLANFFPYLLHPASEENLVKLGYPLSLVRNEEEDDDDRSEVKSTSNPR